MSAKRKCIECGLLAWRRAGELLEVDEIGRSSGENLMAAKVFCSAGEADLTREFQSVQGDLTHPLFVIKQPRDCTSYCNWHPGLSPKDHKMLVFDKESRNQDRRLTWIVAALGLIASIISSIAGTVLGWWLGSRSN